MHILYCAQRNGEKRIVFVVRSVQIVTRAVRNETKNHYNIIRFMEADTIYYAIYIQSV